MKNSCLIAICITGTLGLSREPTHLVELVLSKGLADHQALQEVAAVDFVHPVFLTATTVAQPGRAVTVFWHEQGTIAGLQNQDR